MLKKQKKRQNSFKNAEFIENLTNLILYNLFHYNSLFRCNFHKIESCL
jgi:hypothetical protein